MNWCLLIPLLVGLISALLGYLLGKLLSGNNDELLALKKQVAKLETDLNACKKSKIKLETDLKSAKESTSKEQNLQTGGKPLGNVSSSFTSAVGTVATIPFKADAAKAALGKKVKQDDLKIVEGIGPKIEGLFHNFGIKTWKALGETSIEKCQEVLNSGGDRYKIHKPGTWPRQARLAYQGRWEELVKWQDELDGGKA
ncbi:hypothetical protein C7447_101422 [Tenacibaculum adriaticum]|uniref:Uncharacterized protein n=1 Tax=Tenacibaculum adriaticum TaxID=413713 RepID=A0A5S5DV62_9FLAO|nr:hypothetical protein [Tenacibaculum adriaticum]TYP99817.1 hypothetical protein C7447_101422 [Tenacibaculum adriaticum]